MFQEVFPLDCVYCRRPGLLEIRINNGKLVQIILDYWCEICGKSTKVELKDQRAVPCVPDPTHAKKPARRG